MLPQQLLMPGVQSNNHVVAAAHIQVELADGMLAGVSGST